MQCVSTTAYSISINGSMHGFFKGKQGIRQGNPISPFLFVLCLEYLSRSLNQLKDNRDFNFHPKCQGLNITHLAFADDLMLFSRGDVESVQVLMNKMRRFGDCSGLRVSMEKSNLYAAGISRDDLEAIKSISGFSEGRFPFRYLGLPVASTKLTIAQFHPFTDRIAGYLNAWAGMKLSYAGRCELIRSILQGVECFWLASLYIPAGIRDRLIRMCRNFLWGGQCYVFKKALVAWESICLPKMEGGLGFKNLEAWNLALLSKNLWNIQAKKDSLWVRWIHLNHLQNSSIWDYNGRKQDSAMLRQVLSIRDKICELEGSMQAVGTRMEQWVLDGRFCSKAAYEFFRPRKGNLTWPKVVWHTSIIPKHSFILWLGLKGRLLTRDKMQEFSDEKICPLCNISDR